MLRPLARLASQARLTFGAPQDIEWAIEANGSLVLLQSRPITALGDEADATGPVFGPGPVAETFGLPLRPLEEDLWVAPLRDGLREALTIAGATPARPLRSSPVVVTVGGRVAVDLGLLGLTRRRRSVLAKLDPRPPAAPAEGGVARRPAQGRASRARRRSDRGGRPRPQVAARPADPARSGSAPAACVAPTRPSSPCTVTRRSPGCFSTKATDRPTAASAALRILAQSDDDARRRESSSRATPCCSASCRPASAPTSSFPVPPASLAGDQRHRRTTTCRCVSRCDCACGGCRSSHLARRLRSVVCSSIAACWNHRATWSTSASTSSRRCSTRGARSPSTCAEASSAGPPLPAAFRLTDDGVVVPVRQRRDDEAEEKVPAVGAVPVRSTSDTDIAPAPGAVLVVRTLDPGLAAVLPGLGGLGRGDRQRAVAPRDPRPRVRSADGRRARERNRTLQHRSLGGGRRYDG